VSFTVKEWGEVIEDELYVTYPELWLATFMQATHSPRAMKYLRKRDVPDSVITRLDLRYDTEIDAICFPVRDFNHDLCGLRARRLKPTDDEPRYHIYKTGTGQHNKLVWYGEDWLNFDKPVLMCESVFDVASVLRVYENVCAPMTAGFTEGRAKRMRQAIEIITLFDADTAGDKARDRVNKFLSAARITHAHPPEGKKDAGEMTVEELRELLSSLVKLKPETS
jgi:DNA primase